MNTTLRKQNGVKFPKAKIRDAVQAVLPRGADFRIRVFNSKIGGMKVVRVVTPAWKSLAPYDRIFRLLNEVNSKLSQQEKNGILRFSVLTPRELSLLTGKKEVSKKLAKTRNSLEINP